MAEPQTFGKVKILFSVLLVGAMVGGCATRGGSRPSPDDTHSAGQHRISEFDARIIATREFNIAIQGKRFADAAGQLHEYRKVGPPDWKTVSVEENRWSLRIPTELGVGQYAWVTMALDGRDPKVEGFGFSIE